LCKRVRRIFSQCKLKSVSNLKKAFIEAVEDYLVLCKEAGKEPQKSYLEKAIYDEVYAA